MRSVRWHEPCEVVDSMVHDVTTSCWPFLSLQPQSHAHSLAMSWQTRLSSGKTRRRLLLLFFLLFQPHGEKCGPLNNWDRQCLPPWCYPRAKKALQWSILILPYWNSRQFMKHFSCLRLWCHQFSGFGSLLHMSFLWKILSQWENVCQNVSAQLSFKEWHLIH